MRVPTPILAGMIALALGPAARAGDPVAGYTDTLYVGGLTLPTAIGFLPDGRLLITEKGGSSGPQNAALKLFDGGTTTTLGTVGVCTNLEMGLAGVEVDPNFSTNGFIYLYRTESDGGCASAVGRSNEVVRVTMSGMSIGSLTVVLTGIRTDTGSHHGGTLRYNAVDGKLYVSVGDAGTGDNVGCPGSSTNPYAQDLNAIEGKVLRLNLDGTIPSDNPFFGQVGKRGEIFAYGFRNPFRFSFDPVGGGMWLGDVGDRAWEEIDLVTAGSGYAWPHCEATLPMGCQQPGDVDPIFAYPHTTFCAFGAPGSLGASITGGSFGGGAFGSDYVFGDYVASALYQAEPTPARDGITGTPQTIVTNANGPVDIVTGPDGAIYYVAINTGEVRRLFATPPFDDQLIAGRKLRLRSNLDPTKDRLNVVTKDAAIDLGGGPGSGDDPTLHGGQLRVASAGFDDIYPLPQSNWSSVAGGYRYRDTNLSEGPVKTVLIRAGTIVKAVGRGAGLGHLLASDPNPASVELTTGAARYCMSFGGTAVFVPGKSYSAKDAAAPASCLP